LLIRATTYCPKRGVRTWACELLFFIHVAAYRACRFALKTSCE
jgi:hypothetical protein